MPKLSLIIPLLNEKDNIPELIGRIKQASRSWGSYEVIFVDDGSIDATFNLLKEHMPSVHGKIISFTRNFGHQIALSAGLKYTSGEYIAMLDGDLQDPPELIGDFLEKAKEGYDVVYAIRARRKENLLKRLCYRSFYRLLQVMTPVKIPLDAGDFCLMSRRVVDALNAMPEHSRFIRGLRSWTGYRAVGVSYDRASRSAGSAKYTTGKLVRLAIDGFTGFSDIPLKISTYLGFAAAGLSAIVGVVVLILRLTVGIPVPGWASIILAVFFVGGVQLFIIGVLGEYLARVHDEVRGRPLYIIEKTWGFDGNEDIHGKNAQRGSQK